jgi:anti-sigma-K factor RskA
MMKDRDVDGIAAEYVLGSLDASERQAVDARRKSDAALRAAIVEWEERLGTLSDRLPGIAPPPDLYSKILASIASVQQSARVVPLRSPLRRRMQAAVITALAACLVVAVGWFGFLKEDKPSLLVAQLHRVAMATADESSLPAFAISIDPAARILTVHPVAVRAVAGRRYVLWLLGQTGDTPTSLGGISASQPTTLPWLTTRPLGEFVNAKLAISAEQEGDAQTSTQTTPVTYAGTLVVGDPPKH